MADYREGPTRDNMELLGLPSDKLLTLFTVLKKIEVKRRKSIDEGEDESSLTTDARMMIVRVGLATMSMVGLLV